LICFGVFWQYNKISTQGEGGASDISRDETNRYNK